MSKQNKKTNIKVKQEVAGTDDDPHKQGLQKKARKRYNRYLRDGMRPEEARVRAIDPEAYQQLEKIKQKIMSTPAVKGGLKRKAKSPATAVAPKRANKSPETQGCGTIDVAILATGYPLKLLTQEEATKVEEALVAEMLKGCSHSINFAGIHFRNGLLIVKCRDDKSKQWLELAVPKVLVLDKVLLRACPEDDLPSLQIVTIHLPRAAGVKPKTAVSLLREQNRDLHSETWDMLKCIVTRTGGAFVTLGLKPAAFELLQQNGMEMSYRFEQLPCQLQTAQPSDNVEENAMWYVDIPDVQNNTNED
ncbi:uncharacterized protein LOC111065759 [Drosophila obscura]|uniref:uncharacterized protein LOC111065759 n=1 Tax=Drosophila obscura TaxID=7282 RepID=UPI001BB2337E|nr:uncharacterized protein LOC111065759 [Drosophila obscura]